MRFLRFSRKSFKYRQSRIYLEKFHCTLRSRHWIDCRQSYPYYPYAEGIDLVPNTTCRQRQFTITEVGILVFHGDEKESSHPSRTYMENGKYIWWNKRECFLVLHGAENNSKFVMAEEDHRYISERLPILKAAESKRAKQEQREKQEKIAKLNAGDPKDMSVILLREVLMEMGVSFKSSESKAKLIEKVIHARLMQNDTCDENLFATPPSADAMNDHTVEPREVQDSLSSSIFFNNNASSSSSSSLLSEREKIIIDTQEIYLQNPLVYFDFDLKKKIVLLLHLLFILSIVTVRYSQMSNILRLVQRLLSKSLLIAFEEFEKILHISSQIFFVMIQLLYVVACVAVRNFLKFVLFHESNTSSCHLSIAS